MKLKDLYDVEMDPRVSFAVDDDPWVLCKGLTERKNFVKDHPEYTVRWIHYWEKNHVVVGVSRI